jgi:hypothetical protein
MCSQSSSGNQKANFVRRTTRELSNDVLDQLLLPGSQNDKLRQTIFPDLDYNGLFKAVQSLADDIQLINTGAIGQI